MVIGAPVRIISKGGARVEDAVLLAEPEGRFAMVRTADGVEERRELYLPRRAPVDPRPFYVLYRNVDTGYKGRRTFATRAAQTRFVANAPWAYAITAYN